MPSWSFRSHTPVLVSQLTRIPISQLTIPLKGGKSDGTLYAWSSWPSIDDRWDTKLEGKLDYSLMRNNYNTKFFRANWKENKTTLYMTTVTMTSQWRAGPCRGGPPACSCLRQVETYLKDTGLASAWAVARRRPIWKIWAWRTRRLSGRWPDVDLSGGHGHDRPMASAWAMARRRTERRWTRRRAAPAYVPTPDLTCASDRQSVSIPLWYPSHPHHLRFWREKQQTMTSQIFYVTIT